MVLNNNKLRILLRNILVLIGNMSYLNFISNREIP